MPNMDVESIVRCALALNYIPGFTLCLAQGIDTGVAVPVVGIVPLTGSLVMTGLHFSARRPARLRLGHRHSMDGEVGDNDRKLTKLWNAGVLPFALDLCAFGGFQAVLAVTWYLFDRGNDYSDSDLLLMAYATFPLMINWLAHLFLAFSRLGDLSRTLRTALVHSLAHDTCPNCPPHYRAVSLNPSPAREEDLESGIMTESQRVRDGLLHGNLYDADSRTGPRIEQGSDNGSKAS